MVETDPAVPDWGRFLTDQQWTEVVRHSGLRLDARPRVGIAVATYRRWQAIIDRRKIPSEIRDELERLRKDAEALMTHLAVAMTNADTHFALTYPLPRPKVGQLTLVRCHRKSLISDLMVRSMN